MGDREYIGQYRVKEWDRISSLNGIGLSKINPSMYSRILVRDKVGREYQMISKGKK